MLAASTSAQLQLPPASAPTSLPPLHASPASEAASAQSRPSSHLLPHLAAPSASHSRPTHLNRVRTLSFLRRPNRSSPPASPPHQAHLERAPGFPLASDTPQPATPPSPATSDGGPSKKSNLAPDSNSSMARLRRAFSSQNGVSPQTQTSAAAAAAASSTPKSTPRDHQHGQTTASPAPSPLPLDASNGPGPSSMSANAATPDEPAAGRDGLSPDQMPTIKFIPHQDPRASKPSLAFASTSRTLPHEDCVIRVGRYSERDGIQNPPSGVASAAPVGFKSKVVSRKHCEFWCSRGQWYIKDVKSSSGTFLNHIRLSQPNTESKPFPINDGDVVQLGIDFKGGEEAIFRCVKIRIECNRNWQKKLNDFNMNTHKQLRELNKTTAEKNGKNSTECAICLMPIAPCQSLFMAPCSHIWHFKCIQPMLNDHKTYPQFVCPNCRAVTDLEADIEDTVDWNPQHDTDEAEPSAEETQTDGSTAPDAATTPVAELGTPPGDGSDMVAGMEALELGDTSIDATLHSTTRPVEVPGSSSRHLGANLRAGTPSGNDAELMGSEGPLTPRNDAGPFVFDGSAGRATGRRVLEQSQGQNANPTPASIRPEPSS